MGRYVTLPDGVQVPAIGQGTWFLGERKRSAAQEMEALASGIESGMSLIDSAEMYGDGKAEQLVGKVIRELDRSKLFLVSKVYPHHAGKPDIFKSCENSLRRMGTDYLDLYLLHWRGRVPLEETIACMEQLKKEGKIRRWGVSNFDTGDMQELWRIPGGQNCAVNQVLYHVASRGIEYDLLPWMREHHMPVMAYCPLAQGGALRHGLYESPVLKEIANNHHATISQVLLAFTIRNGDVIAIPRSARKVHTLENAQAGYLVLSGAELLQMDRAFPPPKKKISLDIV